MAQPSPWTAAPAEASSSPFPPGRSSAGRPRFRRDGSNQIGEGVLAVQTIDLAYVERGVHEELVAYVADQEGYFEEEGVHVAVRNGIGWDPERLRRGASIGLGRAVLHRLTGAVDWKVLSVNTHRPLFWFVGSAEVTSMADLRGRRVAVHPAQTAPGWFTRIVLRTHGLDPDRDLECITRFPVNYQMDL